jgi:hypothetical protein
MIFRDSCCIRKQYVAFTRVVYSNLKCCKGCCLCSLACHWHFHALPLLLSDIICTCRFVSYTAFDMHLMATTSIQSALWLGFPGIQVWQLPNTPRDSQLQKYMLQMYTCCIHWFVWIIQQTDKMRIVPVGAIVGLLHLVWEYTASDILDRI